MSAVEAGAPLAVAAPAQGVPAGTARAWIHRGRAEGARDPYRAFATAIDRARARAAQANVAELHLAGRGGQLLQRTVKTIKRPDGSVVTETTERFAASDWRASAWWLERQYPEEFAPVERRDIRGSDGGPVDVGLTLGELYRRDPAARALGDELADRAIESGALEGKER